MKNIVYLFLATVLLSCDAKVMPDCFQNAGPLIQMEFEMPQFSKIIVFERVQLILKHAPEQKIVVETGKYLRDDIVVQVVDDQLILKDNNGCNLSRDYGITKVYVSAPNITSIRSSTDRPVLSDGVLGYPELALVSEDHQSEYLSVGDFKLEVNCINLKVTTNNSSHLFLSGTVEHLDAGFFSGTSRFEGRDLIVQNIIFFQRSSNDMIFNPQQSISGEIRSTGDVILVNEPPVIEVQEFYTGRLIVE